MEAPLTEIIAATRTLCREALACPELAAAADAIEKAGLAEEQRRGLIRHAATWRRLPESLDHVRTSADPSGARTIERYLLVEAALRALPQLDGLAVADSVKKLICREFQFFANPPEKWLEHFAPGHPLAVYCGITLLEWLPAGPLSWVKSGLPRSWLLKVPRRDLPRLLRYVAFELRGFRPLWYPHVSVVRAKTPIILERDYMRSYYWLAQSLPLQPQIRGVVAASWLYSPTTAAVSPHLAFAYRIFTENGGLLTDLGEATPESGFLAANSARKKLYECGQYKPREALALWSRRAILAWAAAHPELGEHR